MVKLLSILVLAQSLIRSYSTLAHFYRSAQVGHEDRYQKIPDFNNLFRVHENKTMDQIDKTLDRLRNRMYRRRLQAMIDNLTIGAGAHAKRHTDQHFENSKPFAPGPEFPKHKKNRDGNPEKISSQSHPWSRAKMRAKRFQIHHSNN